MLFCFGNMELQGKEFIRQQWRMWIETVMKRMISWLLTEFIRQQWRMWIETGLRAKFGAEVVGNSFASNGECGLKP